jgi:predicted DNA-binding transcriptional regulator YafY
VPAYEQFRTFLIDRIERLTVTQETFRRSRELPNNLFGQSMGVFWGEPEAVEVEFDAKTAPFVRGRVWHESQTLEELPEGRLKVMLNVSNDWALRSWLLGFGAGVLVIEPVALAQSLREELQNALRQYGAQTAAARRSGA